MENKINYIQKYQEGKKLQEKIYNPEKQKGGYIEKQDNTRFDNSGIVNIYKKAIYDKQKSEDYKSLSDIEFRDIYGESRHKYKMDSDPNYNSEFRKKAYFSKSNIQYPKNDLRRSGSVPVNAQWMYPNLTGSSKQVMTNFSNDIIGFALPIPGIDKLIKPINKVNKVDNLVNLVKREKVFSDDILASINRYNDHFINKNPNSGITMSDKIKIGRDIVGRKNLNKAYRNTHIDEIIDARNRGYFNNNRFPETDWYYGGSAGKYGPIEIETVPDDKYFRLFKVDGKYTGIITPDPDILHLKGTNVPYKGSIVRYKGKELSEEMLDKISKEYNGSNLDELVNKFK